MQKVLKFLLIIYICLFCFNVTAEKKSIAKNFQEKIVELSFKHQTVTTRDISSLLENKGKIFSFFFQNNFSYLDENMTKSLSQIYSVTPEEYEYSFKKQMEKYGFFDEAEKIERQGVLLKKIIVQLPNDILEKIKKIKGIQVNKL